MTPARAAGDSTARPRTAGDSAWDDYLAADTAAHARTAYLRSRSLYAAVMLAQDLTTCRALLYGRPVPQQRLDQEFVRALDLEPGSVVGLTANLVEQVLLHTPLEAGETARRAA